MSILVREEEKQDYRRVEEITRLAFSYPGRIERGGIGCPYEHWMVNELRRRDGILPLSLVATECSGETEELVGHIICSKAEVRTENGVIPVLNMGPISVLPECQRRGVGKTLIYAMIEKAKKLDYGAILFFGRPEYYPQFGFKEAAEFGVADAEGYNYPSFMGMELIPGYLKEARGGKFYESDIYNDELNRETVRAFDEQFRKGE
ncbi:MAG: N-acetyltransferase [Lachnospiraceae bacterium]|nr:N-acetyltransferase [Lachnospiraceae bacterium]MBQ8546904.1 N-acetyltransferase [Lachnospiraceae bacterium]